MSSGKEDNMEIGSMIMDANFNKVNIYQMPQMGRKDMQARAVLQLKEHWKDKFEEAYEYCLPNRESFYDEAPGQRRTDKIFELFR